MSLQPVDLAMDMNTRVTAKLIPGQNGTKRLQKKYGDRLICVRYRQDDKACKRLTTIELIVDEVTIGVATAEPPTRVSRLRIGYTEIELRQKIKQNGGIWNPDEKTWHLPEDAVKRLGLEDRIVNNQEMGTSSYPDIDS